MGVAGQRHDQLAISVVELAAARLVDFSCQQSDAVELDGLVFGASVDGDAGPFVVDEFVLHSVLLDDGRAEGLPPVVVGDVVQLVAVFVVAPLDQQRAVGQFVVRGERIT